MSAQNADSGDRPRPDGGGHGGGPNAGPAYVLSEIDPDTLPDDPDEWFGEVARRIRAWQRGQRGWRTGDLDHQLDDYRGEES